MTTREGVFLSVGILAGTILMMIFTLVSMEGAVRERLRQAGCVELVASRTVLVKR